MGFDSRTAGAIRGLLTIAACAVCLMALAAPSAALASESEDAQTTPVAAPPAAPTPRAEVESVIQERVMVIGSEDAAFEIPGSAHRIDLAELERHGQDDVHRVLRRVPGMSLQEEEGYGLRPNIGMRGTGVERSQKITVLEDGVLAAPAPYAAPAAYYFPVTGRMTAVEVRKGSSSIKQGPFTNGGALNLISRRIPDRFGVSADLAVGSDAFRRAHVHAGDAGERFGWFVETYQLRTDGFKRLDGGGETGFDIEDYLAKLRWNSAAGARAYQSLELKLGRTDQFGDETYLGLTADDFRRTPYRRYAASAADTIDSTHSGVSLTHFLQLGASTDLTSVVYRNDFRRNWHKLDSVDGAKIASVLATPEQFAAELAILRGEADSGAESLVLRNNRRDYYSEGVQTILGWRHTAKTVSHALEFGVRFHRDAEDRFQEDDAYRMESGSILLSAAGAPASQSNRVNSAEAVAVFAQDTIRAGRWTLIPGFRLEDISFTRLDFGKDDPTRSGVEATRVDTAVSAFIPGLGVSRELTEHTSLFAGIHRGFAPPGPGADARTRPEESLNYELGARYRRDELGWQVVGFFSDYANLLGRDTLSGGGTGTGDSFNGGAVRILGVEASAAQEFTAGETKLPVRVAYTFTEGEFLESFETSFADWAPEVERGDELPYSARHTLFAEAGIERGAWSAFLAATFVDEMRTVAGQGPIPEDERIGSRTLFDLSARYAFTERVRAFLQVRNLTDEVYLAARRPAGLRPGIPRTISAGLTLDF